MKAPPPQEPVHAIPRALPAVRRRRLDHPRTDQHPGPEQQPAPRPGRRLADRARRLRGGGGADPAARA
ncbi:hypothetical protein C0046_20480, partial [Pseudomonas aeruginosa]